MDTRFVWKIQKTKNGIWIRRKWFYLSKLSDAYVPITWTIIGPDKRLLPVWHQAIIQTNVGWLLIGLLNT